MLNNQQINTFTKKHFTNYESHQEKNQVSIELSNTDTWAQIEFDLKIPALTYLYIDETIRNQGIGTYLIQTLCDLLREEKHDKLYINNITPGKEKFYQKNGMTSNYIQLN